MPAEYDDLKSIIWRENDKRVERYVRIVDVGLGTTARHAIRQCREDGKIIGHNTTRAKADAFGRRYKEVGRVD